MSGQGAERERIFIDILGIAKQRHDKIPGPHVMNQIAEKLAAKWVVAHVLNGASAISIGVRGFQFVRSGIGKSF